MARQRLQPGDKLVSLNAEVTAETKQELIELAGALDDGLSYGRTIQWLLKDRKRLAHDFKMAIELLHDCVTARDKQAQAKDAGEQVTSK